MKLWKVTHKETEKTIFVLAERWMDVRTFGGMHLEALGDYSKITVEQSAPFVKMAGGKKRPKRPKYPRLKVQTFRLEWHGHASGTPSTLHLVIVACHTIEELYGEQEEGGAGKPSSPRKSSRTR